MNSDINLPVKIVKELMERGHAVATKTAAIAADFSSSRLMVREKLSELILKIDETLLVQEPAPSISATDGAFICDNRSLGDLCTAVAVRVGPGDENCDSSVWMDSVTRSPSNNELLGGVMSSMEIELSAKSLAQVVLMDGSMLSNLINISKAIFSSKKNTGSLSDRVREIPSSEFRASILEILSSPRFVALPKYTTINEFALELPSHFANHDARTIMTMALLPGEMTYFSVRDTGPRKEEQRSMIGPSFGFSGIQLEEFTAALDGIITCYYRPHSWTPAFRIDMTQKALDDADAQLKVLRAVRDNTMVPGLREPFPLYLVDLFAKHVSVGAAPVVDMATLSSINDPDARLLLAMGYRS